MTLIWLTDVKGGLWGTYSYDEFVRDLYPERKRTQPFGFAGHQADDMAGTYFAQARAYMPSVERLVSHDADKFISIENIQSISLYHYCISSLIRYTDSGGNDPGEQYPLSRNSINDAVQIKASGNEIRMDMYAKFERNKKFTTENGTSCKDMAISGIENWFGNYLDVFGKNVTVSVNVHEGNS